MGTKINRTQTPLTKEQRREIAAKQKVQKAPGKVPKVADASSIQQTPTESLIISLTLANLPSINTDDEKQVLARTQEYFNICVNKNTRPTIAGYALALGVNRLTLIHWVETPKAKPEAVQRILQRYFAMFENLIEIALMEGQAYPLSTMFLAKNNLGYKDKREINIVAPETAPTAQQMREELELLQDDNKPKKKK